ncbi:unnamed protein product [Candidula unifasciata]|uniref:AIG1-type G domain-containing protein n=1 Tax=Candidula unifasciata TaxID=100452 RepID=A0A8S3ZRT4_9EUPU|nr:unnamed protein product [Candidula unifasciata]
MAAKLEEEVELCLIMLGKTGAGKSATGNTILDQRLFNESSNASSETKVVSSKFTRFDNFIVKVVDCPGLMDTDLKSGEDKEKAVENMGKAIGMCNGGVDAFIVVTKRDQFTAENQKSLDALKSIFGDKYCDNLIVVVVGGDTFQGDMEYEGCGGKDFHTWCREQTGPFRKLYDDFNDRFLLINNREKDPDKKLKQRREIIHMANSLKKLNGKYTSTYFKKAKALQDKLIVEENLPFLNETIQERLGLLTKDLLNLKKSMSGSDRDKFLQKVDDLKKEIREKDRGTGLLNKLMEKVKSVESALDDVEKTHTLARKIEQLRKGEAGWSNVFKRSTGLAVVSGITAGAAITGLAVAASPLVLGAAAAGYLISVPTYAFNTCEAMFSYKKKQAISEEKKQIQAVKEAIESKVKKQTG